MNHDSTQLWNYALALYAQPGVADACLALQDDAGADVCELLWLCWLERRGLTIDNDADEALAAIRTQQATLTGLLRQRRRTLKALAIPGSPLAEWRQALKSAELAAERDTLMQLEALAQHGHGVRLLTQDDPALLTRLVSHVNCHTRAVTDHLNVLVAHIDPRSSEPTS